jgi:enoyl-CoA hydratase
MSRNTSYFMRLFECHEPTIAKVRGFAVAGGSDIALACDMVVTSDRRGPSGCCSPAT